MEEFTNSTGIKIFYNAIAAFMLGFSLFLFTLDHTTAGPGVLAIPIFLTIFALVIIVNQIKYKVAISADNIVKTNIFGNKELQTANVKGCRIGDKVIYIEAISPEGLKIIINNYSDLGNSEDLVSWIKQNFANLDATDLAGETKKILSDTKLGVTESERTEKLTTAKRIAIIYNVLGVILGFSMIFFNNDIVAAILMLSYPIIGIVIIATSKGLTKFVSNSKRSVYSFVMLGFIMPIFIMLIKSLDEYQFFQYGHIWLPFAIFASILFGLLYTTGVNSALPVKGQIILMAIVGVLYGYGSTEQINCVFDRSSLQVYSATVLNHRVVTGKSNTYYFTLGPWGPRQEEKEVEVGRSLYHEITVGGTVKVNFKNGLLNIPWFTISD